MADIVKMPKLGFDMAEGMLVRWVVGEGEAVETGQVLAEIETDKATVEVEAPATGIVRKHVVQEGTSVPVGVAIAVIGAEGEDLDGLDLGAESPPPPSATAEAPAPEPEAGMAKPEVQAPTVGDFPGGVKASPVARRLAQEMGIDLTRVEGSGPGGRVVKADVEAQGSTVKSTIGHLGLSTSANPCPPLYRTCAGEQTAGDHREADGAVQARTAPLLRHDGRQCRAGDGGQGSIE